jgi:hypothetical protein
MPCTSSFSGGIYSSLNGENHSPLYKQGYSLHPGSRRQWVQRAPIRSRLLKPFQIKVCHRRKVAKLPIEVTGRNDVLPAEKYCKHHKRLREIELQGPYWLNKMIEEMKLTKK